jgi:protein-disulfide isomerase
MRNLAILIAVIGVCSFIAANYFSNAMRNTQPTETSEEASNGAQAEEAPKVDIAALKAKADKAQLKRSVPEDAVDVEAVIYGNSKAPIVIEEFASFTCNHCASFYRDNLPGIKKTLIDTGLAQLHFYSFVRNPVDIQATMLVQCQKDNKTRKSFLGALLNGQEQWVQSDDFQQGLRTIAKVGGMSDGAFDACIADDALMERVINSRQWFDAQVKVDATPYFRIGDEVLKGSRSVDVFTKAIEAALAKKPVSE